MNIKNIVESKLFDENEQVVILSGDANYPNRHYTGYLYQIPSELFDKKVELVSSMGERRRNTWNLNKYGWLEIWLED
jgi:hypothetical protein